MFGLRYQNALDFENSCFWLLKTLNLIKNFCFRCTQKTVIAGLFLAGASFALALMLSVSVHIHENFLGEHMRYLIVTIIICSIGVICGLFHVYKDNKGYASDFERRFNTFLGYTSCYLIYFGMVFWMIFMFKYVYSTSLQIMIALWVAFGVGPFILAPIARRIYHGKSLCARFNSLFKLLQFNWVSLDKKANFFFVFLFFFFK